MDVIWTQFTKRTEDPKLSFLEGLLTEAGIFHKREGESWHAPIVMVPEDRLAEAEDILAKAARKELGLRVRHGVTLDDLDDDHRVFYHPGFKRNIWEDCPAWWVEKPHDFLPGVGRVDEGE